MKLHSALYGRGATVYQLLRGTTARAYLYPDIVNSNTRYKTPEFRNTLFGDAEERC